MSTVNPCPLGGYAEESNQRVSPCTCQYPAIGVDGDICCCVCPSTPPQAGTVTVNVVILPTNNLPPSLANQVGWQITVSPSSCGSPVSGTGTQSGVLINIDNCNQVTLTLQVTSTPSTATQGVSCSSPQTVTAYPGSTVTFNIPCWPTAPTGPTNWTLNVSVNDPYGAGYIITDNYGDSLQAARSLTTQFATYSSSITSVTLNAQIQFNPPNMQCSITPSTVTVNAPSGGTGTVTQSFTVACATTQSPSPSPSPSPTAPTAPSIPLSWTDIAIILAVLAASGIAGYGIAQAVKQK